MAATTSESGTAGHWDRRYALGRGHELSWFQERPGMSLDLIAAGGAGPGSSLVDVGAGESRLVDHLLAAGWRDLTVLDVSPTALQQARARVGARDEVAWVPADVRGWRPGRRFDVWHDRAVFHFLVEAADREAYLRALGHALAPRGLVVVGTFAADGPAMCSGLPVARYDAELLVEVFGPGYDEIARRRELHRTPQGVAQPFTWVALRARAASA